MRSFLRTRLCRFVSAITAFTMLFTTALSGVHVAYAAAPQAPPEQVSAPAKPRPEPTVVRELVDKRRANVTQYLLSDGTTKSEITQLPTRFKSGGTWVDIDTSLMPTDPFGGTETAATSATVSFSAPHSAGAPVKMSGEGFSIGIDMLGATEGPRVTIGDTTHYLDVAPSTDLEYQATRDGVKETVILKDRSAASSFQFKMDLDGLRLRRDPTGHYTLVREDGEPVFDVGSLVVLDSSVDVAGDPAYCADAKMTVAPAAGGGAIFTYDVPRSWIDDPARVFPIKVDPTITGAANSSDKYITSAYPNNSYNTTELRCGEYDASTGKNRSFVYFTLDPSIFPTGAYISSAKLQLYNFWQYNHTATTEYRVARLTSTPAGTTWNTRPTYASLGAGTVREGTWSSFEAGQTTQDWLDGTYANYGFMIFQMENGTQGKSFWKKFYSSDYSDTSKLPKLVVVSSSSPGKSAVVDKTVYRVGDIVTATLSAVSGVIEDTNCMRGTIWGHDSDGGRVERGQVQWTRTAPSAGWTLAAIDPPGTGGGYISYRDLEGIELLAGQCTEDVPPAAGSTQGSATFKWQITDDHGDVQDNDIDVLLMMDPVDRNDTGNRWTSTTQTSDCSYRILPWDVVTKASATTTASSDWFVEADTNGDGKGDNRNDGNTSGRGSVSLSWADVADADSYSVHVFDGYAYRQVGTSAVASWSSAGKGLYPTDTQVFNLTPGTTGNPLPQAGAGVDLRDDPTPLYAKTLGTAVDNIPAYFFKIVPVWGGTQGLVSEATTVTVQLANRTKRANEAVAHTVYDLGSVAGDSAQAELDSGALTLSATDLAIDSYGPPAVLARTYRSDVASATTPSAGWCFNFEQSVVAGPAGTRIYTDESGVRHLFTAGGVENTWAAPHSMTATLAWLSTTSSYELLFKGGTTLRFDATGRLVSETDRRGDAVTYAWSDAALSIEAANRHTIEVSFSGEPDAHVTSATYTTSSGTRRVDYDAAAGSVTRHLSASENATVTYSYDASGTLSGASVADFAPGGVAAAWGIAYDAAGKLQRLDYPHPASIDARYVAVAHPTTYTATVSRPARVGLDSTDTTVTETFVFDPTGRQIARGNAAVSDASRGGTETGDYAPSGRPRHSVTAAGVVTDSVTDSRGNEIVSADASGHKSVSVYNATDDLVSTTDPREAVTTYEYGATGDVTLVRGQLSASTWSQTALGYGSDTHGRVQTVTSAISATRSAEVVYADYGAFTQPATVTYKAVALSAGDFSGTDLVTRRTFDGFGQMLTETDPAGVRTAEAVYDLSGRVVSVTDAAGATTNHRYDVLGSEIETSRTAGASWSDWASGTVDPTGLTLTESRYLDIAGSPHVGRTTVNDYDGSGQRLTSDVSDQGRYKTAYDAKGVVANTWLPSAGFMSGAGSDPQSNPKWGTSTVTDADGRLVAARQTIDETSSLGYTPDGDVAATDPAGETTSTHVCDPAGNEISSAAPAEGNATATVSATYDLGGRCLTSTNASGVVTTFAYDLLGRSTSASIDGAGRVSYATYNALGWVLEATSPDGLVTRNDYDTCGRVTRSARVAAGTADATTIAVYDAAGRPTRVTSADLSSIETTYDPFGRTTGRVERDGSSAEVHRISTLYDEMGRAVETSDTVTGSRSTCRWAVSASGVTTVTRTIADSTITVSYSPAGPELGRKLETGVGPASTKLGADLISRDGAGRPCLWEYRSGRGRAGYGLSGWDEAGRLSLQWDMGAYFAQYHYDPRSGRETSESVYDRATAYTYTPDGRLAAAVTSGESTRTYTYNAAGQITHASDMDLTYDAGHLASSIASSAVTSYAFDLRGRRTGQVSPDASATYTWSAADRLTGYTLDRGRDGSNDVTASYSYDASGQRTRSVVASAGVVTTSTYVWEGTSLAQLVSTTAGQATTMTYLYSELGKPMALSVSMPDTSTTYTLPIWTDVRGDVLRVTEYSRAAIASWTYDPYGRPVAATVASSPTLPLPVAQAVATLQPLRYAGYVYDAESGLYYCSQRYYDPASAQFISRDAIGADAQESAYQYCGGDPVGKTDPSGMAAIWGESAGTKFDAAVNAYTKTKNAKRKAAFLAQARKEAVKEKAAQAARDKARAKARADAKIVAGRAKDEVTALAVVGSSGTDEASQDMDDRLHVAANVLSAVGVVAGTAASVFVVLAAGTSWTGIGGVSFGTLAMTAGALSGACTLGGFYLNEQRYRNGHVSDAARIGNWVTTGAGALALVPGIGRPAAAVLSMNAGIAGAALELAD